MITALIGWSNQIKETQTETKRIEKLFTRKLELKYPEFKKAISKNITDSVESEVFSFLNTYKKVIKKDLENSQTNTKLLNEFSKVQEKFEKLQNKYNLKYLTTLWFGIVCLLLGSFQFIVETFFSESTKLELASYCLISIPIILIVILIYSLISIHTFEKSFQDYISKEFIEIED